MLSSGHKTKGGRRTRENKLWKAGVVRWNVGDGDGVGALCRRPGLGLVFFGPKYRQLMVTLCNPAIA